MPASELMAKSSSSFFPLWLLFWKEFKNLQAALQDFGAFIQTSFTIAGEQCSDVTAMLGLAHLTDRSACIYSGLLLPSLQDTISGWLSLAAPYSPPASGTSQAVSLLQAAEVPCEAGGGAV